MRESSRQRLVVRRATRIGSLSAAAIGLIWGCGEPKHHGEAAATAGTGGQTSGGSTAADPTGSGGTGVAGGSGGSGGTAGGGTGGSADETSGGGPFDQATSSGGSSGTGGTGGTGAGPAGTDMVLMVDYTSSMDNSDELTGGLSRWDLTVDAIMDFVNSTDAADTRVALQFFSYVEQSDCDIGKYSTPAVAMGFAPEVASDVEGAINDHYPIGLTPTYPALAGAIDFAEGWQSNNLDRQTVVVFVTDGYPTECDPQDVSSVAELAANSWNQQPKVAVYVVGLDGVLNLNLIAEAGGTGEAFDIQSGGTGDELLAVLLAIAHNIPSGPVEVTGAAGAAGASGE